MEAKSVVCPLCASQSQRRVEGGDRRTYFLCPACRLIFVSECDHLSPSDEKARYATHRNSIDDQGYVDFLNRLLQPVSRMLSPGMRGLDYGCGPGPTLSALAVRQGFHCEDYDPFFFDRELKPGYDFILSTECFEHFHRPSRDIGNILKLLAAGGILGVMTETWRDLDGFSSWYYTRDPTHVCFYHMDTISHICNCCALELLWSDGERVFIMRKL